MQLLKSEAAQQPQMSGAGRCEPLIEPWQCQDSIRDCELVDNRTLDGHIQELAHRFALH